MFQLTAARRRLEDVVVTRLRRLDVSTHSRPKAAGKCFFNVVQPTKVSTHSRTKAAGGKAKSQPSYFLSFNSQPPEGGWATSY